MISAGPCSLKMMSAVKAEEDTVPVTSETTPAASAQGTTHAVSDTTTTSATAHVPNSNTSGTPASPQIPLPDVVHGIDANGSVAPSKPDKWNTSIPSMSSLKSWMSEAVRISKDTAQTAQRVVAAAGVHRDSRPRILCIGDSLTANADVLAVSEGGPGWGAILRARYDAKGEVLTRGVSGYNTRWGLSILPRVVHSVDQTHVRAVLIWFGANDAAAASGQQHVPLEEYRLNLAKMVNYICHLKTVGTRIVPILITPPPLCDEMRYKETGGNPNRTAGRTREYADACVEVACELKVPFVDVHSAMLAQVEGDGGTEGVGRFLRDGLHFNTAGNELVEKLILETLETHLKKYAPSSVEPAFPDWTEIDVENPTVSLGSTL